MGRLFTFGCSFTSYKWPTWADLLSLSYDSFENWGKPGGGNRYIFESIVECDVLNDFSEDDTVVIMWSTHQRFDRYHETDGWITPGNVFNSPYSPSFIKNYWSIKGGVLHSSNAIKAAQEYLSNKNVKWYMASMMDLNVLYETTDEKVYIYDEYPEFGIYGDAIGNFTNMHWAEIPLYEFCLNSHQGLQFSPNDTHPTPRMHHKWLTNQLLPIMNIELSDEIPSLLNEWDSKLTEDGPIFSAPPHRI